MARVRRADGVTRLQQHRAARRAGGMKLLRIWVPDPRALGFAEEARRQAKLLAGAPEEAEALDFIEMAADWAEEA